MITHTFFLLKEINQNVKNQRETNEISGFWSAFICRSSHPCIGLFCMFSSHNKNDKPSL